MLRNQKIARQPRNWFRRPPIMGAIAGPSKAPIDAYPMYEPRSEVVITSETIALPNVTVLLLL